MAGSDSAIKRRLAKLSIGQSKLHAQTQRNHMCTPISAATQRPSAAQIWKRDQFASRRELRDSFDQEIQVAPDASEIDVFGVTSWGGEVEIVWHVGSRQSRGFAAKHGDRDARLRLMSS